MDSKTLLEELAAQLSYKEVAKLLTDRLELEGRLAELQREFRIVDEACEFWKDTALDMGYPE